MADLEIDTGARREEDLPSRTARLSALGRVLESFTRSLDLDVVMRHIVDTTLAEMHADRAWLLHPVALDLEYSRVVYEAHTSGWPGAFAENATIPLGPSRELIRAAIDRRWPVQSSPGSPGVDPELWRTFQIRNQMMQILVPREGAAWALGLHRCASERAWSRDEEDLFAEIGRYATIALNNSILHERAMAEAAKTEAILDQIPEAAAIYGPDGRLERVNTAAKTDPWLVFGVEAEERLRTNRYRHADGGDLTVPELPSMRALRGENVKGDFLYTNAKTGDERVVNLTGGPIRDQRGNVIGSVVLSRDVTVEREKVARDLRRRARADCLANLSADLVAVHTTLSDLDDPAKLVGQGIGANVRIYLYSPRTDEMQLVGSYSTSEAGERMREYLANNPHRAGEGLPGTVFEIGKPLLFSEIRGDAIVDFGRNDEERALIAAMREQSLIATPIESYGDRIGVLLISSPDARANYDAEDLTFAQAVADRIGAAAHIHKLNRISQEGHRAAEELARREVEARARLEAVLESSPIGIAVISADELRFELANPRWVEYATRWGKISLDTDLIGLSVAEVLPGLERELREVAEQRKTRTDEALEVRAGRHTWYLNRIISPVTGRFSGETQSLTVLMQDVSAQVLAQNEIEALAKLMEERSARLASILGSMTDALWVYDAMGNVVDVNPAALAMFGLGSRGEAVSRGALIDFEFRAPDGTPVPPHEMPYARALRGEVVPDYLVTARQLITGRQLDLSIAAAPIESGGIVGAILVIRDVTAIQELDRKKDEFLSVASHELRTPLTTIKGYAQLLAQLNTTLEEEERASFLSSVLGEVDRMMGLISELLDVSRIETRRLEIHTQPVDWISFLTRHVANFRIQNPNRIIEFETEVSNLRLELDIDRMRQVIDNLLNNAAKYSPDGTPIRIVVQALENEVRTAVIDQGIGIPDDERPLLFERFHRARNVSSRYYGGLGLGLYIARAIIEAHRGAIEIESVEGHGSTFTVTLPR